MVKEKELIRTVIDFGNAKIKVLVSKLQIETGEIKVIGYSETPTQGLKKSLVENSDALTRTLEIAIKDMEYKLERKIDKVILGVSSPNIKSRTINKKVEFEESTIGDNEVELLYRDAEKVLIPEDEKVLNKEMYNIRVNNSGILKTPKGVVGKELQGDVHFISLNRDELQTYEEVANRAGLEVEDIKLNVYGAAKSVLDEEEKLMGVALIDIGEGITDIIMYKNGKMIHSKSIPLGAMHYVNDLSYILEINREEAHDILKKLKEGEISDEKIVIDENKTYTVKYIRDIIDARTEDIANFIIETIDESGFNGYLGKGLVVTGGAIVLDELLKKISQCTGYKVIKKGPGAIEGLEGINSSMAGVIGITQVIYQAKLEEIQEINARNSQVEGDTEEKTEGLKVQKEYGTDLDDEIDEEEKVEKSGFFSKLKEVLSNYI